MRLCSIFTDMTFVVDRINGVRDALGERTAALPATDKSRAALTAAADHLDALRKRIVATKEGGMLTGEQRLREDLDDLYGNVVFYEGPPTATEVERAEAIARELADTDRDFETWVAKTLPGLNARLGKNTITVLSRSEWDKAHPAGNAAAGTTNTGSRIQVERD